MNLPMLGVLTLQGVLGLYSADDDRIIIEGPLAKTVSDAAVTFASRWHGKIFNLLLVLVAVHVSAVIFYRVRKKDPLIEAMVTGRKPALAYEDDVSARPGSPSVAVAGRIAAFVIVIGGILLTAGNPLR